jgi:hypothetical protein
MRPSASTLALAGVLALLSTGTAGLLWTPLAIEDNIARQALSYPPLKVAALPKPTTASLAALRSSPVFYRSRETLHVEDPATIAASRPQYVLQAAVLAPQGRSFAYVKSATGGEAVRVRPGASLDGWVVKTIDLRRVVAARGGQTAEILPPARPGYTGLIRVPLSGAAPTTPTTRLLTAVGGIGPRVNTIQPLREARTYRAPPAFAHSEAK